MTKDLMSADEWGMVWRRRSKAREFKERVKNVALAGMAEMIRGWADQCDQPVESITELGCAPGVMLRWVHRACPNAELYGVDYAQEGLEQAKDRLRAAKIPLNLMLGDVFTFDPPHKSPLVVSFGLIEHFSDPVEILRCHARFTTPGGRVAVTVPNFSHPAVLRALKKHRPHDLETHRLDIMNEAALRRLFEQTGYQDVRTGTALGPLLPASVSAGSMYGFFAMIWNALSGFIPDAWFWPGLFWASGIVPENENL